MPGPVIIEPQNTGDAPLSYQLAAGQTLEVLAVAAEFDGTLAAGSFVPAVGFYAADGRRLARCPAPATVAAGSSSEVSFFPFAPPASSSGGGGVSLLGWESVAGGSATIAAGGGATITPVHANGDNLFDFFTFFMQAKSAGYYSLLFKITRTDGNAVSSGSTFSGSLATQPPDAGDDGTLPAQPAVADEHTAPLQIQDTDALVLQLPIRFYDGTSSDKILPLAVGNGDLSNSHTFEIQYGFILQYAT